MNNLIILWSDALIFFLGIITLLGILMLTRQKLWRDNFKHVFYKPLSLTAALVLGVYVFIGFIDSIHFQPQYKTENSNKDTGVSTSIAIESVLDKLLKPLNQPLETTYSAPFALYAFTKELQFSAQGEQRVYPRLNYIPALVVSEKSELRDVFTIILKSIIAALLITALINLLIIIKLRLDRKNLKQSALKCFKKIWQGEYDFPWRTLFINLFVISAFMIALYSLSRHYHIFGTDKVGQDVFYLTIKSIRTGLLIGTLTTLIMLPFALWLGIAAGFFGGKVDDLIQYVYTTLSSIPGVLLIAAAVLSLQVFIANHADWFPNLEEQADIRLLALCAILGVTSWTSLCRLLRAETLKLRELDFIAAAQSLGVSQSRILWRHILPNVMHIVIITVVLDFSALVLAEAVLSYVGVGVAPTTISWGNMINSARLELAREPVVWWPITAAFIFMFILVLGANIFSDAMRDAFDPRMRERV